MRPFTLKPGEQHPLFTMATPTGLMSGENPRFPSAPGGHEALKRDLDQLGATYEDTHGHYGAPERSLIIHGLPKSQLYALGKKYGQESVIHSEGGRREALYTNGAKEGKVHPGLPSHEVWTKDQGPPSDWWTQMPHDGGYVRLHFDFDKLQPSVTDPVTKHEVGYALHKALTEVLDKASWNVKQHTRNLPPEKQKSRIMDYIRAAGFRARASTQDRFGVGKDQHELTWNPMTGGPEHELAHAIMTPVGSTLREHQKKLGQVYTPKNQRGMTQEEGHAEEAATFGMEPAIGRRAGVQIKRGGGYPSRQPGPGHINGLDQLHALEEGRKAITSKGQVVQGTSIDSKINARALKLPGAHLFKKESPSEVLQKAAPSSDIEAVAADYNQKAGLPYTRPVLHPYSPELAAKLASTYETASHQPNHPEVKAAYDALKRETMSQYKHLLAHGYRFTPSAAAAMTPTSFEGGGAGSVFVHHNEAPYKNDEDMLRDLTKNKHLYVFNGGDAPPDHPMAEPTPPGTGLRTYNDVFRAVHDVFGHGRTGAGFGSAGEDQTWRSHMGMYSPPAQKALTTETRGQNAAFHYGKNGHINRSNPQAAIYPDQKAAILSDEFHKAEKTSPPITKRSNLTPQELSVAEDNKTLTAPEFFHELHKGIKERVAAFEEKCLALRKAETALNKKDLDLAKVTPADVSEATVHKLKGQYGYNTAAEKAKVHATAWKIHNQKKAEPLMEGESVYKCLRCSEVMPGRSRREHTLEDHPKGRNGFKKMEKAELEKAGLSAGGAGDMSPVGDMSMAEPAKKNLSGLATVNAPPAPGIMKGIGDGAIADPSSEKGVAGKPFGKAEMCKACGMAKGADHDCDVAEKYAKGEYKSEPVKKDEDAPRRPKVADGLELPAGSAPTSPGPKPGLVPTDKKPKASPPEAEGSGGQIKKAGMVPGGAPKAPKLPGMGKPGGGLPKLPGPKAGAMPKPAAPAGGMKAPAMGAGTPSMKAELQKDLTWSPSAKPRGPIPSPFSTPPPTPAAALGVAKPQSFSGKIIEGGSAIAGGVGAGAMPHPAAGVKTMAERVAARVPPSLPGVGLKTSPATARPGAKLPGSHLFGGKPGMGKAEAAASSNCPKCGENHKGTDHATAVLMGPEPKVLHPSDKKKGK